MTLKSLKLRRITFLVLILTLFISVNGYSQDEFDKVAFGIKPDFYAENEEGVSIAYRFYENVVVKENGKICYNALSYDGWERKETVEIVQTNSLLVMYDYNSIKTKNKNYSGVKIIRIPEKVEYNGKTYTVVSICNGAFEYCHDVEEIILPNTIHSIHICAFGFCENLKHVKFPNKIQYLGTFLFEGCTSIEYLSMPSMPSYSENIKQMSNFVLGRCSSIKEVELDNTWYNSHISYLDSNKSSRFIRMNYGRFTREEMDAEELFDFNKCYDFKITFRD